MTYYHVGGIILALLSVGTLALLLVPSLKGARTYIFQGAILTIGFILPVLAEVMNSLALLDWREYVPQEQVPWVALGVTILQLILRKLTTTPPVQVTKLLQ